MKSADANEIIQRRFQTRPEIRRKIQLISEQPHLYQLRPEIGDGARLAVFGRYVILFRVQGDVVRIERVVYGGRDLPSIFP